MRLWKTELEEHRLINPYALLRTRAGYSQKAFGTQFGFAKQTLISIEAGTYPELSERMIVSIADACAIKGIDPLEILRSEYGAQSLPLAYKVWQQNERHKAREVFSNKIEVHPTDEVSPMLAFVFATTGSVQGFSKKLKVPAAMVLRYAKGLQREMPMTIRLALLEVDFAGLARLTKLQTEWIDKKGK